jgi:hypothetical protein
VLLSTAQLPHTAHKCLRMFTTLSFLWTMNSITACCLKQESATDAILKIHYSSAICRNDSKLGISGRNIRFQDFKTALFYLCQWLREIMWGKTFWTTFVECVFNKFPKYLMKILLDFDAKVGREDIFKPTIRNESLHNINNDTRARVVNFTTSKLVCACRYYLHIQAN